MNNEFKSLCRCCESSEVEKFEIKHFVFSPKSKEWDSFYCYECGAVSDFNKEYNKNIYSTGNYRDVKINGVKTPIDFYSEISFLRWKHIDKIIRKYLDSKQKLSHLDYGGYTGFLQFALKQKYNFDCTLADFDEKGLAIAKIMGLETINLNTVKITEDKKKYNFISLVHVIEHMEKPLDEIHNLIKSLNNEGIIYAEVPNVFCFPMSDKTHLTNFSIYAIHKLFKKTGLKILDIDYCTTPRESIKHNYYYNSKKENIYVIAKKTELNDNQVDLEKKSFVCKNILEFKKKLLISYSLIMLKDIPFNLSRTFFKNTKTAMLFSLYGLIDLVSLKLLNFSIINKLIKKK